MAAPERICPACQAVAGIADTYCSACGPVLARRELPAAGQRATPDPDYVPLTLIQPEFADPHPLSIVPNPWRQRRKLLKRGLALLFTLAITGVFALTLILAGDREGGLTVRALAVASGLLTLVALGCWVNVGVKRVKKRARRQEWRMSAS